MSRGSLRRSIGLCFTRSRDNRSLTEKSGIFSGTIAKNYENETFYAIVTEKSSVFSGHQHLLIVFVGDDVIHTGQKIIDVCVAVHKALLLVAHYRECLRADSFCSYGLRREVDNDFK